MPPHTRAHPHISLAFVHPGPASALWSLASIPSVRYLPSAPHPLSLSVIPGLTSPPPDLPIEPCPPLPPPGDLTVPLLSAGMCPLWSGVVSHPPAGEGPLTPSPPPLLPIPIPHTIPPSQGLRRGAIAALGSPGYDSPDIPRCPVLVGRRETTFPLSIPSPPTLCPRPLARHCIVLRCLLSSLRPPFPGSSPG